MKMRVISTSSEDDSDSWYMRSLYIYCCNNPPRRRPKEKKNKFEGEGSDNEKPIHLLLQKFSKKKTKEKKNKIENSILNSPSASFLKAKPKRKRRDADKEETDKIFKRLKSIRSTMLTKMSESET